MHEFDNIVRKPIRYIAVGWFGTIMDEVGGMASVLGELMGDDHPEIDQEAMALAWRKTLWRRFSRKYASWPELAYETLRRTCRAHGVVPPHPDHFDEWDIVNAVPRWPMFAGHVGLAYLSRRLRCAVISQLDGRTLGPCLPRLSHACDKLITSEYSRSYKPAPAYFKLLAAQLQLEEPEELLVVSADTHADLEPAAAFGYQTLLVTTDSDEDESEDGEPPTLKEAMKRLG